MRLAAAVVAAGVVVAGLTAPTTAQAGAAPPGYTPPPIVWGRCADGDLQQAGATCGDLVVPLDYARPGGEKIRLAVSRVLHTSPDAAYQGVMLTNPGGPGGSGQFLSILGQFVPNDAGGAYDWIGFDPRGVGASRPSLSCDGRYFGLDRPSYVPRTRHLMRVWLGRSRHYARACATANGRRLLAHSRTRDTVQDMESLREALGQETINFYGFSYGTYLGPVYATLHPTRVRRFVLDSNVDPRTVWYRANLNQDVAFDRNLRIYFRWLARYDRVYHLGSRAGCHRAALLPAAHPARPPPGRWGPRTRRADRPVHEHGVRRLQLGDHRPGVRRPRAPRTVRRPGQPLPERQPGRPGRRQRVRDVPRHPVHRRPVAEQLGQAATRQPAPPPHAPVPDVGQRLVQRALHVLARGARVARCRSTGAA